MRAVGQPPPVSVVVPCHLRDGREAYAQEAVRSALAQTFYDLDVLFVDDASPLPVDGLALPRDPRLHIIRHARNRGVSAARNTGWHAARSPLVAFLDDDDVWLPTHLARMVPCLERDPEAGLAIGLVEHLEESGAVTPQPRYGPEGRNTLRELVEFGAGAPSTYLFRRSLLDELGGFDPQLSGYSDLDIILRAAERSVVVMLNQVVCHYRVHSTNMSRNDLGMGLDAIRVWEKFLARHGGEANPGGLSRRGIHQRLARQHHRVARVYAALDRPREAFDHLRQAVRLWPSIGRSFEPAPTGRLQQAVRVAKPYGALLGLAVGMTPVGRLLRDRLRPR